MEDDAFCELGGSYERSLERLLLFDGEFGEEWVSTREEMFDPDGLECLFDAPTGETDVRRMEDTDSHGNECSAVREIPKKARRDRTRTIASERKRRRTMKERLYELRSLVPNITKMDKASIIADAIVYVKGLQMQARKLKEEISMLEFSSLNEPPVVAPHNNSNIWIANHSSSLFGGKIHGSVAVHQVGEKRFYVKVECSGSVSSLYNAMESLSFFQMESSVLASSSERYICSATFQGRGAGEHISVSTMQSWVMTALLQEGFLFDATDLRISTPFN
ncbi:hypothetical protein HPP92_023195 [Vanilla planifolia]|uniref:BHLH domain-containing protein n=1 Tax=Vanilla planifolia TaxID=51239 RepID=A0A835PSA9_VANPL|nr:hypothetical protein HPP92_023195 [Vanilla planifolia]